MRKEKKKGRLKIDTKNCKVTNINLTAPGRTEGRKSERRRRTDPGLKRKQRHTGEGGRQREVRQGCGGLLEAVGFI